MKNLHLHSVSILYPSVNFLIIPIDPAPPAATGRAAVSAPTPTSRCAGDSSLPRGFARPSTRVSARGSRESLRGRLPAPSLAASTAPRLPSPRVGDGSRCSGDSLLPRWPLRPPLDSRHRAWETGVVARATPRSLAGRFDRPSTPVTARGRRESLRGRFPARSRRLRPPFDPRLCAWETGVVARATPRSLAAAPTAALRPPSPLVGDGSRCASDSPLARGGSDCPPTPVSARGRRESLRERLLARSRRRPTAPLLPSPRVGDGSRWAGDSSLARGGIRPSPYSRLRAWETGVVARATPRSLAAGPTAPQLPSPCVGDGSRWPGNHPFPRRLFWPTTDSRLRARETGVGGR